MILNLLPISANSGVLNFDMKIFVNVARLEIGQLCTQGPRRWHPCTLDTFLVPINSMESLSCHSDQSTHATAIKNSCVLEAHALRISAKFQLYLPNSF